jgi:DNA-binding MarR family transcriptional regulator
MSTKSQSKTPISEADANIEEMALEIFGLTKMSWLSRQHSKVKDAIDLSETEFLTLDMLILRQPQTVGEIQKQIGVLPAQMSRIVRALETKFDQPLIRSEINPEDKRKVDITLTDVGTEAHDAYQMARVRQTMGIVAELTPQDRDEFIRILRLIRKMFSKDLPDK